jgi:diphosphomevalonate decarboxylase
MPEVAEAIAHSNIALVKYWGKAERRRNLPATGSLSLTLDGFFTRTRVTFASSLRSDEVLLNGRPLGGDEKQRVVDTLNRVRRLAGIKSRARVESENNFPTAAGLASSASGFAALSAAAVRAAGLRPELCLLAELARRGSGSAPRSLLGGFVELRANAGAPPRLVQVAPPEHWKVGLVVVQCTAGRKEHSSRWGMELSRRTSPFYSAWLESHERDQRRARRAICRRDIDALGSVMEHSALKMHAVCLTCRPALVYFSPVSWQVVLRVRELRKRGLSCYFTMDAGPQVKVLCPHEQIQAVAAALRRVPGVLRVWRLGAGSGVEFVQ